MSFPSTASFAVATYPATCTYPVIASWDTPVGPVGQPEIFTVQFAGIDGAALYNGGGPGLSITFWRTGGGQYYEWFFIDDSNSDPGLSGTGIQAPGLSSGDPDTDVATSFASGVNTTSEWTAVVAGTLVTVTAASNGARTDAADVDTGAVVTTTQQGS